jgi:hypothetical protein
MPRLSSLMRRAAKAAEALDKRQSEGPGLMIDRLLDPDELARLDPAEIVRRYLDAIKVTQQTGASR